MNKYTPPDRSTSPVSVSFSVIASDGSPLTKRFRLDDLGAIMPVPAAHPYAGTIRREDLMGTPTEILKSLASTLERLDNYKAIVCAPPPTSRREWRLVRKDDEAMDAGAIARTKTNFAAVEGPALLCLDLDIKDYPAEIRERLEKEGGVGAMLERAFPELAAAACLSRPSVSSFVAKMGEAERAPEKGQHRYYVVRDGQDAEAFAKRLADRLRLSGWAWASVGGNANVLQRGALDAGATDPSRLLFEAGPILGDGLNLHRPRTPQVKDGGILDTRALVDLTPEEKARLREIEAAAAAAVEGERARVFERRKAERVEKARAKGATAEQAEMAAASLIGRAEMWYDDEVHLDDGSVVTVEQILAEPAKYQGKTCAMPFEPEYGGGKNKAIIYTDGSPHIFGLGHGGTDFRLVDNPLRFFRVETPADATADGTPPRTKRKLRFLRRDEIRNLPPPEFVVARHIPEAALGFLYGQPGSFKSFLALDFAMHIACGLTDWHGDKITAPPSARVIYLAREGAAGMNRRIEAWERERVPLGAAQSNFILMPDAINLLDPDDLEAVVIGTEEEGYEPVALIVVDTVSRSIPGADENSQQDMTRFVAACDRLKDRFNCTVLGVHHSSKNGGMRGSSVMLGAGDFVFEAVKSEANAAGGTLSVDLKCAKMKEAEDGWTEAYWLESVCLGIDKDDKPIASLVPRRAPKAERVAADTRRSQRWARIAHSVLGGRTEAAWSDVWPNVRDAANAEGLVKATSKQHVTPEAAKHLGAPGIDVAGDDGRTATVLMYQEKERGPWKLRQIVWETERDTAKDEEPDPFL